MSKKLKKPVKAIVLVVGGLYKTTEPMYVYEEAQELSNCFTNLGNTIPADSTLLCLGTSHPKQFVLIDKDGQNKKVFTFRVAGLQLLSDCAIL